MGIYLKRYAAAAAAVMLMIMLFTSCGSAGDGGQADTPELRIGGVIYAPYFYRDIDGNFDGIDVELAREACSRMGYRPSFDDLEIGTQLSALDAGAADCVWSCISMDEYDSGEYKGEYMWAGPYLYSQRVMMVKTDSEINKLEDLTGKRVGVQAGSASESVILQEMKDNEFPEIRQLTSLDSLGKVFTALKKDYVDAVAGHESALNVYADEYPDQYRCLNTSIRNERLGVAFRKDADAELVDKLYETLKEMKEDGTTEAIIKKYGLDVERNVYGGSDGKVAGSDK